MDVFFIVLVVAYVAVGAATASGLTKDVRYSSNPTWKLVLLWPAFVFPQFWRS